MSEKKLAYDFWNTPEGIRSQKIFDMRDRIRRLEASNAELLEALVYLLKQCEENERNKANFMGTSTFAREQANKAIQKASGQE